MKIDRRRKIHEALKEAHNISINDLCDMFGVSKNTIRRDIADLQEKGIIEKVYGGIVLADPPANAPEPFAHGALLARQATADHRYRQCPRD